MGKKIEFSERYRRRRYRKEVTPDEPKIVIDFVKANVALRRLRRFTEYSKCLSDMEAECVRLVHQRRCGFPHSPKLPRRAIQIFIEETDDLVEFLKNINDTSETATYLGAAGYAAGMLWKLMSEVSQLPLPCTAKVAETMDQIEMYMDGLRYTLAHIFAAETSSFFAPAYRL